jgi:hypothetical protein
VSKRDFATIYGSALPVRFGINACIATLTLTGLSLAPWSWAASQSSIIPFVGCPAEGQAGPLDPPTARPVRLYIDAQSAKQLAYYRGAQGAGALAPRGWSCRVWYASSGSTLVVTPAPIPALILPMPNVSGPAVVMSATVGGTSGRFGVAETAARYFPEIAQDFIQRVKAEGTLPAGSFDVRPYPHDAIHRRGPKVVEYTTPAQEDGRGTEDNLEKSSLPIHGLLVLDDSDREWPDMIELRIRLPENLQSLTPVIENELSLLGVVGMGTPILSALSAQPKWEDAEKIVAAARAWRAGMPLPSELTYYYRTPSDLPSPRDTDGLIQGVSNLPLLAALTLDLDADSRCREDALTQGMYVGGPSKFFAIIRRDLQAAQSTNSTWLSEVRDRLARKHVVVDALSIDFSDMSDAMTSNVMTRIEAELKGGAEWDKVYTKYSDEFGYRTGNRTKVGNLGHFVLFPDPALGQGHWTHDRQFANTFTWEGKELPRRLSRISYFDPSHLSVLLAAQPGDVIRLRSKLYRQNVLYQVQEVYSGEASASAQ